MAKIEPPINGKEFRVIHYYKTGTFSTANIPNLAILMQFISVLQSCKQGQRVELIPEDLPHTMQKYPLNIYYRICMHRYITKKLM